MENEFEKFTRKCWRKRFSSSETQYEFTRRYDEFTNEFTRIHYKFIRSKEYSFYGFCDAINGQC